MDVPVLAMNNGKKIPQIALGLWQVNDRDCHKAVQWALDTGYRHFDSAQRYRNEQALGEAIRKSQVPRSEVFITTKIANENQPEDLLIPSFEESLRKLGMEYVDLLLLHFPVTETRRTAWPLMEDIYDSGRAKSIGVSNYMIPHLEELLSEYKIKPAVNQVELHVYLQQPELIDYCKQNDIVVEAYSPLARGDVDDPVLEEIAAKHQKTAAQIMLRWCLEVGTVPLPKSVHKDRIESNVQIFDFHLDDEDMQKLRTLDQAYRTAWDPTRVA